MEERGFYFAAEEREEFGISVALVWEPTEKDLQLSIMLGNYMLAVGFTFQKGGREHGENIDYGHHWPGSYFGSRYIFRGRRDGDNVRTGSK